MRCAGFHLAEHNNTATWFLQDQIELAGATVTPVAVEDGVAPIDVPPTRRIFALHAHHLRRSLHGRKARSAV